MACVTESSFLQDGPTCICDLSSGSVLVSSDTERTLRSEGTAAASTAARLRMERCVPAADLFVYL